MDKKTLIEKLQEILEFEYTDIFIYNNEANLFKEKIKGGEKLAEIYKDFALEELTHADNISKQISSLGRKPLWEYKNIFVSNSIRESLKLHLEREIKAYKAYTELIKQIEDREFKILLKGIRDNEKQHIEQISKFLKKIVK
ncbi:MAG: ferritin-like domain-containing protein [Endomicrobiia bacterium]